MAVSQSNGANEHGQTKEEASHTGRRADDQRDRGKVYMHSQVSSVRIHETFNAASFAYQSSCDL
jgi:hypothetical protein